VLGRLADIEKISSSEYAIDGNLSRFTWIPLVDFADIVGRRGDEKID
jgi:hypothetical protein